jgi:hypothetical protein
VFLNETDEQVIVDIFMERADDSKTDNTII